jgi:cysteine desulfurase family protein (TIGR01976 family)
MAATFDVARVRGSYPALSDGHAYLDGAAGTQVPVPVIDAIADAYRAGIGNIGGAFAASGRSGVIVAEARGAVADLTGGTPSGVVFGPSMTALTYRMSAALARGWAPGDEIVVSRLDHDANIRPWAQAAARAGAVVRWAEADLATGELPAAQYADLVSDRTRLVAVTAASNVLGTRPDVAAIAAVAHAAGALCYVDGVHATPHIPVDVAAFGADFYATSAYKWAGPHVAAVVADPALLETLRPDKLAPSSDEVPARFERGTLPFADLAGMAAAVEHLASLAPGNAAGAASRRERLLASMTAVEEYEMGLFARLLDGLGAMGHVTLYGKAARRTPTAFFTVADLTPREVASRLAARGVNTWNGDNYAYELCGALGLEPDGAVRAGLVHYNDASDVDRLLAGVGEMSLTGLAYPFIAHDLSAGASPATARTVSRLRRSVLPRGPGHPDIRRAPAGRYRGPGAARSVPRGAAGTCRPTAAARGGPP